MLPMPWNNGSILVSRANSVVEEHEMEEPQTQNHEHGRWAMPVAWSGKKRCLMRGEECVLTLGEVAY